MQGVELSLYRLDSRTVELGLNTEHFMLCLLHVVEQFLAGSGRHHVD